MTQLKTQAIQTALQGDWETSISLNIALLEEDYNDIDTLNRLAFAYSSNGNLKEAKSTYQKVLELDNQNPIALRNIKRINDGVINKKANIIIHSHVNNLFIEEPGRTKIIDLLNVADKKVISPLRSGETLQLVIKRMKIFILDQDKQYVGMLPDDIGRRLIRFIDGGNQYEAYIKSVDGNKVTIFAREVKRVTKFKNQPSFLPTDRSKLIVHTNPKQGKGKSNDEESENENDEQDNQGE